MIFRVHSRFPDVYSLFFAFIVAFFPFLVTFLLFIVIFSVFIVVLVFYSVIKEKIRFKTYSRSSVFWKLMCPDFTCDLNKVNILPLVSLRKKAITIIFQVHSRFFDVHNCFFRVHSRFLSVHRDFPETPPPKGSKM